MAANGGKQALQDSPRTTISRLLTENIALRENTSLPRFELQTSGSSSVHLGHEHSFYVCSAPYQREQAQGSSLQWLLASMPARFGAFYDQGRI
ncbi:hypothetical protein METHPM2_110056 [Pseudomonas sp. PM2]